MSRNCYLKGSKGCNSKSINTRVMVLALCMSLMLVNICMKFHEDTLTVLKLQSECHFVLETATYKVQRGITQKVQIEELWLLHSAHRLMLVNICMMFHEGILNSFWVTERTRPYRKIYHFQFQRAITPKICNPELWFLCSACRLMLLYICEKFHENISNGFGVTEQTRFCDRQTTRAKTRCPPTLQGET